MYSPPSPHPLPWVMRTMTRNPLVGGGTIAWGGQDIQWSCKDKVMWVDLAAQCLHMWIEWWSGGWVMMGTWMDSPLQGLVSGSPYIHTRSQVNHTPLTTTNLKWAIYCTKNYIVGQSFVDHRWFSLRCSANISRIKMCKRDGKFIAQWQLQMKWCDLK